MNAGRTISLGVVFGTVGSLYGCGSTSAPSGTANSGAPGRGSINVTIHWPETSRLIPAASKSIKVVVSTRDLPVQSPLTEKVIARPAGNVSQVTLDRLPEVTLQLHAFAHPNADGTGTAQAAGSTQVVLTPENKVASVSFAMSSTIAQIHVSPTEPELQVDDSVILIAEAKNSAGAVVLTSQESMKWASSSALIAAVNERTGEVNGVSEGTTQITITDTESGKSASVTAKVGQSIDGTYSGYYTIDPKGTFKFSTLRIQGNTATLTQTNGFTQTIPVVRTGNHLSITTQLGFGFEGDVVDGVFSGTYTAPDLPGGPFVYFRPGFIGSRFTGPYGFGFVINETSGEVGYLSGTYSMRMFVGPDGHVINDGLWDPTGTCSESGAFNMTGGLLVTVNNAWSREDLTFAGTLVKSPGGQVTGSGTFVGTRGARGVWTVP